MDQSEIMLTHAKQLGLDRWPTCGKCKQPVRQIDRAPHVAMGAQLHETWTVHCHGETESGMLMLSLTDVYKGARVCELLPFQSFSSTPKP